MRAKSLAGLVGLAALVAGGAVGAEDHLLDPAVAAARLAEASATRDSDLAVLGQVLGGARARRVAARMGVDLEAVRGAAAQLSPGERADLASRVRSLHADPGAGIDPDVRELLIIFLIVAIVILVLQAVD